MAVVAPVAIMIASVVMSAAATAVSTYGQIQQQKYAAAVATRNAQIADNNAKQAIITSQINQQDQDVAARAAIAEMEAKQGSSGIGVSSESFLAARKTAHSMARHDAESIRHEGESRATFFKNQAAGSRAEAKNAKGQIPGIIMGGALQFGSSLLGSVSKFGGMMGGMGGAGASGINYGGMRV